MGRPIKFKGHDFVHRRHTWRDHAGRTRSLYARWRDNLKCWECAVSGYGMAPYRWYAPDQSTAQTYARILACRWGLGWDILRSLPMLWDGRPDEIHPKHVRTPKQFDLFPLAAAA